MKTLSNLSFLKLLFLWNVTVYCVSPRLQLVFRYVIVHIFPLVTYPSSAVGLQSYLRQ